MVPYATIENLYRRFYLSLSVIRLDTFFETLYVGVGVGRNHRPLLVARRLSMGALSVRFSLTLSVRITLADSLV